MILLYRPIASLGYERIELPNEELEPHDFELIIEGFQIRDGVKNSRKCFVKFEDQVVPVEDGDEQTLSVFLSIYHNNTIRKNNEV